MQIGAAGQWVSGDGSVKEIGTMNEHHRRAAAGKVQKWIDSGVAAPEEAERARAKIAELRAGIPAAEE